MMKEESIRKKRIRMSFCKVYYKIKIIFYQQINVTKMSLTGGSMLLTVFGRISDRKKDCKV